MTIELDAVRFEDRMVSPPTNPPATWAGWWEYPVGQEVFVEGIGILLKISQDSNPDTDSYAYSEVREMVFEVRDCGPLRWFKVQKASSSFEYEIDEIWEYPTVSEVRPEVKSVTRWTPV
jgi:hypothetical protein